jgi:ABC-type polar amino acid transport system ATPase subunit
MSAPLLQVNDLKKHFPVRGGLFSRKSNWVYAVDGVSFEVERGETLSLVGESGCGKSTVGRAILRLFDITSGQVVLDGRRIDDLSPGALRSMRRRVQVVFQDPFSSLNPRMRVRDILAEPIRNFGLAKSSAELEAKVAALMDTVRLPRDALGRRPHEFSGGQRQRIGIARALGPAEHAARALGPGEVTVHEVDAELLHHRARHILDSRRPAAAGRMPQITHRELADMAGQEPGRPPGPGSGDARVVGQQPHVPAAPVVWRCRRQRECLDASEGQRFDFLVQKAVGADPVGALGLGDEIEDPHGRPAAGARASGRPALRAA